MTMKFTTFFILLALSATVASAGNIIRDGSVQARSDGSNITIQWGTTDETGVKDFRIERRAATSGDFIAIATIQPNGNNAFYEYIDRSAFKTTGSVYQYRIGIEMTNGTVIYSSVLTVTHNVSSVKRTWGSLKAMFR